MQRALRATAKTHWQTPLFKILDLWRAGLGGASGSLNLILIKRADVCTLTCVLQGFGQVWDRFGQVWAGLALVFVQVWDRFGQV